MQRVHMKHVRTVWSGHVLPSQCIVRGGVAAVYMQRDQVAAVAVYMHRQWAAWGTEFLQMHVCCLSCVHRMISNLDIILTCGGWIMCGMPCCSAQGFTLSAAVRCQPSMRVCSACCVQIYLAVFLQCCFVSKMRQSNHQFPCHTSYPQASHVMR